jgi:hypothetical protein
MLIFRNAVFLHVPKTGGSWVTMAVRAGGCQVEDYVVDDDVHGDLSYCPHRDRFIFAFVRHPLALYRSYWRFKIGHKWDVRNPFDMDCAADTFPAFVEKVVSKYQGWCSSMFEDYVGPPDRPIDFIGRYETLADDLVRALRTAGESFDESALRATPPVNVSGPCEASWTPALVDAVVKSEARALQRFGYEPAYL